MELHLQILRQKFRTPCLQPSRHYSCLCGRKRDKCPCCLRKKTGSMLPTALVIPFLLDMLFGQLTSTSLSTEGWTSQQAGCPLSCSLFVLIKEHRPQTGECLCQLPSRNNLSSTPLHFLHPSTTPGPVKHAEQWLKGCQMALAPGHQCFLLQSLKKLALSMTTTLTLSKGGLLISNLIRCLKDKVDIQITPWALPIINKQESFFVNT